MVESRPFRKDDIDGIVACLKRNFDWMSERTDEEITEWFSVLANHPWEDDNIDKNKYNYGKDLIDDGKIVGYFGGIGAERYVGEEKLLFMNFSTWAVDRGIRGSFFNHVEDMYSIPDVITDLTPNQASVMFESKFFGMDIEERGYIRLYPVPFMDNHKCYITHIQRGIEIDNNVVKKEFEDHETYKGIGLARVEDRTGVCYVFYRKMLNNGEWIRILKVSNSSIFSRHCHEITWAIFEKEIYHSFLNDTDRYAEILRRSQNKEWIAMECERRFFGDAEIDYPLFTKMSKKRLYKNNAGVCFDNIDFLYTEYAFLV